MAGTLASLGRASSLLTSTWHHEQPSRWRMERLSDQEAAVQFLSENLLKTEPILASLDISNQQELSVLLSDLVSDCVGCCASVAARDRESGELLGVSLAARPDMFDKQMDRLCSYAFTDRQLSAAVEFIKYVFNRVDLPYHLEESRVSRPMWLAVVSVRADHARQGLGRAILQASLTGARDERCDAVFTMVSGEAGRRLVGEKFKTQLCRIPYASFRGEFREPPIKPSSPADAALHLVLTTL